MLHKFTTDIDCKACLDNALLPLLSLPAITRIAYKSIENGYILLIESELPANELEAVMTKSLGVAINCTTELITDEEAFTNEFAEATPYIKALL